MNSRREKTPSSPDKLLKVNFLKRNELEKQGMKGMISSKKATTPKNQSYHQSVLSPPRQADSQGRKGRNSRYLDSKMALADLSSQASQAKAQMRHPTFNKPKTSQVSAMADTPEASIHGKPLVS